MPPLAVEIDAAPADAAAFEALYAQEFDFVWNVARRLGVPERDLADAAHDVFVVVYRKLSSYDPSRPLRPWLFGIACRVVAGRRRKSRDGVRDALDPEAVRSELPGPDALLQQDQERALVHALLAELSPERRAVLVAHELDELPMPALARELDVPVKTLYSRLYAAREDFVAAMRRWTLRGAR